MTRQTDYSIVEAKVLLSKVDGSQIEVDIRSNVIEFTTWEHLQKPYIDARIVFVDDFGMRDTLSIQGTERLKISIGLESDPTEEYFTKYFFFSKINESQKMNERSDMISLDLVEEHVFVNAVKQISRSYTGELHDIVKEISENELKRNIEPYKFSGTAQGIRKVIVPYLSPLEAMSWISSRATTRTGGIVYFHASMFSNNILLSDLDGLMNEPAFNQTFPLRYSKASASISDKQENLKSLFQITQFKEVANENMIGQYERGAIGSFYSSLDAGTGISSGTHISIRDIVDEFYVNGLLSPEMEQTVFDPSLVIDGKLSDEYNSLNLFQVTSSGTYNQFESYHDESSQVTDNNRVSESRLKVKNKIIHNILKKNIIDIGMDGGVFLDSRVVTGSKVRVIFLNPNANADTKDVSDQVDKRKSGDYMILAMNNMFSNGSHNIILRLTKLGELPRDFSL